MHNIRLKDTHNDSIITCIDEVDKTTNPTALLTHTFAKDICKVLGINMPEICLHTGDQDTTTGYELYAVTYGSHDSILPGKPLVIIFLKTIVKYKKNPGEFISILAHELRHVWQETQGNIGIGAKGFEAFSDRAEIDADDFAIWYLSEVTGFSLKEAADLSCESLKIIARKWYMARLTKAGNLARQYERDKSAIKPSKDLFDQILDKF